MTAMEVEVVVRLVEALRVVEAVWALVALGMAKLEALSEKVAAAEMAAVEGDAATRKGRRLELRWADVMEAKAPQSSVRNFPRQVHLQSLSRRHNVWRIHWTLPQARPGG